MKSWMWITFSCWINRMGPKWQVKKRTKYFLFYPSSHVWPFFHRKQFDRFYRTRVIMNFECSNFSLTEWWIVINCFWRNFHNQTFIKTSLIKYSQKDSAYVLKTMINQDQLLKLIKILKPFKHKYTIYV